MENTDFGEKEIFVEKGKNLYLAVVTHGKPPKKLENKTKEVLREIEEKYGKVAEHWDGDISEFEGVEEVMKKIWD